ncbi:SAM-dependent methyltransferase [Bizionia gelidisalsuginis]|uniref:SAM-dependent methyltransferase n=1 Tax=Bizionia gelidisalsuginis TaxID=291188 RepID=A0ABY3MET5_9FLAO|nr:SAM-dependent methyltransferase [Bizionia gelidisalsuginis]TYC18056.1 SAM-dependent methyltransferase [Bizionia gelidisalsuginis]
MEWSKSYWNDRYKAEEIGWDLGQVSPPLKAYFDGLPESDKAITILIPGGGNAYEAEYLHHLGFKNVFVVDVSERALLNFKTRVPSFPEEHLLYQNFFEVELTFDLIIEQTFFCALDPKLRPDYAQKIHELLTVNGMVTGLLFNFPLASTQPPFGGETLEYLTYFEPYFKVTVMEPCYNSIESRAGKELFFSLTKQK